MNASEMDAILVRLLSGTNTLPSFTPYGYAGNPDHKLVVNPPEAEVVRRIFDLFIDGKSSYDVVTILNAEGIPIPFPPILSLHTRERTEGFILN